MCYITLKGLGSLTRSRIGKFTLLDATLLHPSISRTPRGGTTLLGLVHLYSKSAREVRSY